jgi:signal transduction histidine kinase/ABC-type sugar transport system substrate-binding protein/DNA-binding response OmpR family regulator
MKTLFIFNSKFSWSVLGMLGCLWLLSACQAKQKSPSYTIGFSQCITDGSWRKNMQKGMERELSFFPEIQLIIKGSKGDNNLQIRHIEEFVNEGVDLLIVSPNESKLMTPIIEKAYHAGIPVLLIDRRIQSKKYTAFVGADNTLVGQNAGTFANLLLKGKGNVIAIGSDPHTSPSIDRNAGFIKAIKPYSAIHFLQTLWEDTHFSDSLTTYLKSHQIDLIFAHSDRFALSTYKVCKSLGLEKKIKIIGVDGLAGKEEGLDMVQKGMINATVLYPTGGEEAIQIAVKILKKQPFQKENKLFTTVIEPKNVSIMLSQIQKLQEQQKDIERQIFKTQELNATFSSQRETLYFTTSLLVIVILLGGFLYYLLREKQQSNAQLAFQNQEILKQKDEIEKISNLARQATEDKLRFYSYISHEFRTPLSLILAPSEDLLQRKHVDPKATKDTLQLIHKNANRLLRLVDQLLELRKLDAGKMEIEIHKQDLVVFVKEIVKDFALKAKKQQIDLQFICALSNLPFWFDSEKLDKVLFNIISNAFKYTPHGGLIHVNLLKKGDKIKIIISDNGIGMTPEEKERAFDLFYRGNQNVSFGSGLGLALSREFVSLHQGEIKLISEKGKGTTFHIELPFLGTNMVPETPTKEDYIPSKHWIEDDFINSVTKEVDEKPLQNTIVLIEDNKDLNLFLKEKLSKEYVVVNVETAEKGWKEILDYIPDLIISDVMLPEMDGLSLTQKIKEDFRTSHIPVVLLTAKGQMESRIAGTKAGADIFMTKPFNLQLLEEQVKGLLINRDRMRRRFSGEIVNPSQIQKSERKFLLEFELLIEKNIKDSTLSVEKLSQELRMSRVQLFRKISALTNKNVTDYIADYKLLKAKSLLRETDKTIAEIAYEIGFNNASYFATFFKQKTGETPSQFRNS